MAFRNPVRSLPASRITGQLTGAQIVNGAIAFPHLVGPLASASAVRYLDMMDDASLWENVSGAGTWQMTTDAGAQTTGKVLQSVGAVSMRGRVRIPFDPDVLYRVSVRVRCKVQGSAPPDVFLGLHGFAADGVTPVNRNGAASVTLQNYCAASGPTVTPAAGWVVYTGYVLGRANPGSGGPNRFMTAPGTMHTDCRFVAPYVRLDNAATGSTMQVDKVSVDAVYTGVLTAEAVAAGAIDGQTITGATVRTAAGYPRIELAPDGNLYFYPAAGVDPGLIRVDADGVLQLVGPNGAGVEYGVTFQKAFGSSSATFDTDEVVMVGSLYADNYRTGRVTITPSVANIPASVTVTGIGMAGSGPVRALATPITAVPGTEVRGVGCSSPSRDSVVVWLTRTNTTATGVDWHLIGEA
jgi:hypothetical protein